MSNFIPGKILHVFTTKKGQEAVLRYPKWEDLTEMIAYINTLSKEDTFITFSGEIISKDGEMYFLSEMFKNMEQKNGIYLPVFIGHTMVGSVSVLRNMLGRKRSFHVGVFGISVLASFRGEGIGEVIAKIALDEAKKHISGLQIFTLDVFGPNIVAQSLYKKLGFKEFARLPKGVLFKGEYVDEVKMYKEANF